MTSLIERLEQAEAGSRELDLAIAMLLDPVNVEVCAGYADWNPHPFTTSLDAALTLLPEGWEWMLSGTGTACICHCWNDDYASVYRSTPAKQGPHTPFNQWKPKAATPALALCIACLRARTEGRAG